MSERYVLGSGRAPDWLKERMMLYLRPDGAVGYEIFGRYRNWTAQKGDTVEKTASGDVRVTSHEEAETTRPHPSRPAGVPPSPEGRARTLRAFGEIADNGKEDGYLE